MGLFQGVRQFIETWRAFRSYVVGQVAVSMSEAAFGKDPDIWSPAEYGKYLAISNAVYSCITLRADLLASLPPRPYKLARDGAKQLVTSGPVVELLNKVNPFWTWDRLIRMSEMTLGAWGKCYWFAERGRTGRQPPRELYWARPDRVVVYPDPERYVRAFEYRASDGSSVWYEPEEVIWFRYPNPLDEFDGLSPLAAARLAADYRNAAMLSNKKLFDNGMQAGGFMMPKTGTTLTDPQAKELELQLERRLKGVDKAHRWGVFRFEAQMVPFTASAKEAEFLGGMNLALEDVARAFRIPLDLIGGQRTYQNVESAERAVWAHAILPEARFIAAELTEQLLPMFGASAPDLIEFDTSEVEALQEGETERWTREQGQLEKGVITINQWREERGMDPVPWGDVWWGSATLKPIDDAEEEPAPEPMFMAPEEGEEDQPPEPERGARAMPRAITYDSDEHRRRWEQHLRRADPKETRLGNTVAELFRRQRASVLAKLKAAIKQESARDALPADYEPFSLTEWIKKFREGVRPEYKAILKEVGEEALDDLGVSLSFNLDSPGVRRFLERRVQRFARQVNETTWEQLKAELQAGIDAGEGIEGLGERVEAVMADRIASSKETIARTEVNGALNGGTLLAWRQSGVVSKKEWIAALDDRTRETHIAAHGQQVDLDADFEVGVGAGPAPGQIGLPEEDINCRCSMVAVLDAD